MLQIIVRLLDCKNVYNIDDSCCTLSSKNPSESDYCPMNLARFISRANPYSILLCILRVSLALSFYLSLSLSLSLAFFLLETRRERSRFENVSFVSKDDRLDIQRVRS